MLLSLVIGAIALLFSYYYLKLSYARFVQYADFPQLPTSLVFGHLRNLYGFIRDGKPDGHPDLAFRAINEALGRPPLMLVDLRPTAPPLVIVRSHEVAEQISKPHKQFPYSLPKTQQTYNHLLHVFGKTTIIGAEGERWKTLRKRFSPSFSPQHTMTFVPQLLDSSRLFLNHLDRFARTGLSFPLLELTSNITFDFISNVAMGVDFGAQDPEKTHDFLYNYHQLFETYTNEKVDMPWFFTPYTEWKRWKYGTRVRKTLRSIVLHAYANRNTENAKPRSILSLSLDDAGTVMTPQAVDVACDQLSSFLHAGHDTTSVLLAWLFYELSRTPRALQAVRSELDKIFGPDPNPAVIQDKLLSGNSQDLLNRMTYTTAAIKEALRLWPPAGTLRETKPGASIKVQTSIGEFNLEGVDVYNCAFLIHRDPEVYGDTANSFVPERWLQSENSSESKQIPSSAWRPFERGPRVCMGQDLAMLEARVVVALIARRYDFIKVGRGEVAVDESGNPITDGNGRCEVKSEMYQTRKILPKPVDGMMMQVRL